jgi:hypothetical protein
LQTTASRSLFLCNHNRACTSFTALGQLVGDGHCAWDGVEILNEMTNRAMSQSIMQARQIQQHEFLILQRRSGMNSRDIRDACPMTAGRAAWYSMPHTAGLCRIKTAIYWSKVPHLYNKKKGRL